MQPSIGLCDLKTGLKPQKGRLHRLVNLSKEYSDQTAANTSATTEIKGKFWRTFAFIKIILNDRICIGWVGN